MDKDRVVKTSVALPASLLDWLKATAEAEDRSVSQQVSHLLRRARAASENASQPRP